MPNKYNTRKENWISIVITMLFILGFFLISNNLSFTGYVINNPESFITEDFDIEAVTISNLKLNSTDETTNRSSENLTCYYELSGDSNTSAITWYKNLTTETELTQLISLNMPFEGGLYNLTDWSGSANNGTTTGLEILWNSTGGYDGFGAYVFNNTDYITLDKKIQINTTDKNATVTVWLKIAEEGDDSILGWSDNEFIGFIQWRSDGGYFNFRPSSGGGDNIVSYSGITETNWNHFAFVFDNINTTDHNFTVYINGIYQGSDAYIDDNIYFDRIGHGYSGTYFNGTIDELIIWNRSLTEEQLLALYQNNTDTIVSQETNTNEVWQCRVTPLNSTDVGSTSISNNITIIKDIPNNPTVNLNSTDGNNITTSDLNCSAIITHLGSQDLNATVQWFNNSIPDILLDYNNSYPSGTYFSAILESENTTLGETWQCGIKLYDGTTYSNWVNATSNLTIIYTDFPPTVTLDQPPANYDNDTDQFVNLSFNASVTDGSDLINCSLYYNYTGTWHRNQTEEVTGISNTTNFTSNNLFNTSFIWNIECYDNASNSSFSTANRTILLTWDDKPRILNQKLNSSLQYNTTSEDLTCYYELANIATSSAITWYKNLTTETDLTSMMSLNMPFEGGLYNLTDWSGNLNNGTSSGQEILWNSTGGYDGGGAYVFNETDYITLDKTIQINTTTQNATITVWLKIAEEEDDSIIGHTTEFASYIQWRSDSDYFRFRPSSGENYDVTYTDVTETNWNHYAFVFNYVNTTNHNFTVYINGIFRGDINYPDDNIFFSRIGHGRSGTYFNGTIDELVIWNRSLTKEQILVLYQNKTDTIVSQETNTNEVWQCKVTPLSTSDAGPTSYSKNITILEGLPINPPVNLNGIYGKNLTSSDLNCSAVITHSASQDLNVTVQWFNNSIPDILLDYNNSYSSGTYFSAILESENTTLGETWQCGIKLYDGTTYSNRVNATSNLTIIYKDYPPTVILDQPPANYNNNTNAYSNITFNASIEEEGDIVNCSLYHNYTGTWHRNQTEVVTGISNTTNFTLNNLFNTSFGWNIECYDNTSQNNWGDSNRTAFLTWGELPRILNFKLNSSFSSTEISGNLTCNYDLANTAVTSVVNWHNGTYLTSLNMPFEGGEYNLTDYSGQDNNGIASGATWSSTNGYDKKGAYTFDGINDIITLDSAINIDSTLPHTISFWAKIDEDDEVSVMGDSTQYFNYIIFKRGITRIEIRGEEGPPACVLIYAGISAENWNHYALTFQRNLTESNITLYVNSQYQTSTSCDTGIIDIDRLGFGRVNAYFNGSLDEVIIWERILSTEQIEALYQNKTNIMVSNETAGKTWKCEVTPFSASDAGPTYSDSFPPSTTVDTGILDSKKSMSFVPIIKEQKPQRGVIKRSYSRYLENPEQLEKEIGLDEMNIDPGTLSILRSTLRSIEVEETLRPITMFLLSNSLVVDLANQTELEIDYEGKKPSINIKERTFGGVKPKKPYELPRLPIFITIITALCIIYIYLDSRLNIQELIKRFIAIEISLGRPAQEVKVSKKPGLNTQMQNFNNLLIKINKNIEQNNLKLANKQYKELLSLYKSLFKKTNNPEYFTKAKITYKNLSKASEINYFNKKYKKL